jgi:hypothetical protein
MNKEVQKVKYEKTIVIPIEKDMWKALRHISFTEEISMSQIARDALKKEIKKYVKPLDNNI